MAEDPLVPWLQQHLGLSLRRRSTVSGGCIHTAWRLECGDGTLLFAKGGEASALPLLALEADGLAALAQAAAGSGLTIPAVLALERIGDQALLLLEWLDLAAGGTTADWWQLGASLARLHRASLERPCAPGDRLDGVYGWHRDNAIGRTPQANGWLGDWAEFVLQRRLEPQLRMLQQKGTPLRRGEQLLERARQLLAGHQPEPVLVHGDLWAGNASLTSAGGAVFDPAVYRGDREVDLAMAQLFGGFPPAFFSGYQQSWPLPADHGSRVSLYNLYHLLNHANLFGGGYHAQAQACADSLLSAGGLHGP
ncbi:MAG: fructosamine kinase family protein [Synechococcus sp. ELA057]